MKNGTLQKSKSNLRSIQDEAEDVGYFDDSVRSIHDDVCIRRSPYAHKVVERDLTWVRYGE